MGTRNLTCVVYQGEFVIAQYCQWDGYPEGQGAVVHAFLSNTYNRMAFLQGLENLRVLSEEEVDRRIQLAGKKILTLMRNHGALILNTVQASSETGESVPVLLSTEFASDSLFCEWAYVLDLDNEVLEVYKGFNQEALEDGQRFKDFENLRVEYKPIRCIIKYNFASLPPLDNFIKELDELANPDQV